MSGVLEPEAILEELARLDPELRRERYYGERSLFYNPGGRAPLGTIFCSIKDRDGPNDRASQLSRPGVFRFAFEMTEETYERHFGDLRPLLDGSLSLVREKWRRSRG